MQPNKVVGWLVENGKTNANRSQIDSNWKRGERKRKRKTVNLFCVFVRWVKLKKRRKVRKDTFVIMVSFSFSLLLLLLVFVLTLD